MRAMSLTTDMASKSKELASPGPLPLPPPSGPDYDRIKMECDRMNSELQKLERNYNQAVKASNTSRQQYVVTRDKLEQVSTDLDIVKSQNHDLSEEKMRLQLEVERLTQLREDDHKELMELRQQHRKALSENGSFEGFSAIYDQAVSRYESLKLDYDNLRKQLEMGGKGTA